MVIKFICSVVTFTPVPLVSAEAAGSTVVGVVEVFVGSAVDG